LIIRRFAGKEVASVDLNETYPWKTTDKNFGFHVTFYRKKVLEIFSQLLFGKTKLFEHPKGVINGAHLMYHDPYELPFQPIQSVYAPYSNTTYYLVTPMMTKIDESLISFPPEK
jgi:hypothetical protein